MHSSSIGKSALTVIKFLFPFHASAWRTSAEPIQHMLQEPEGEMKDHLTSIWRDTTQTQLNTISVTSALFGGVIATSYTWPSLSRLNSSTQNTIIAIWYSALVLALTSIAASAQLAVALMRLGSHPDGLHKIRSILGKRLEGGKWKPRKLQLVIWQAPISLLNSSVVMFMIGLTILVWKSASPALVGDNIKIVTLFTLTLAYATALYVVSAYGLYYQIGKTSL